MRRLVWVEVCIIRVWGEFALSTSANWIRTHLLKNCKDFSIYYVLDSALDNNTFKPLEPASSALAGTRPRIVISSVQCTASCATVICFCYQLIAKLRFVQWWSEYRTMYLDCQMVRYLNATKLSPVFRLPYEFWTSIQMVIWIPDHHLNSKATSWGWFQKLFRAQCQSFAPYPQLLSMVLSIVFVVYLHHG